MIRKEDVLARVDIVDVVSHYAPLTSKGRNLVGLCPFHPDHDPSMSVSREKQMFKCFVCGEGGDAIKFVQKYENISWKEALEKVAVEFAGMEVKHKEIAPKYTNEQLRYFELNQEVMNYANYNMYTAAGAETKQYLAQRMIGEEHIDKYHVGIILDQDNLKQFLNRKGFTDEELQNSGMFNDRGKCMFNNRILFPVKNIDGYTSGFTSRRVVEDKTIPKYLNSVENAIFHKSEQLFHLPEALRFGRGKELIVVEGTVDVIGLERVGYENCVAPLGTAFTEQHAQLMKNAGVNVKLCYDGDTAGRNATVKAYHQLQAVDVPVEVAILPDGLDPDDASLKYPEEFKALLEEHNNIFDFYLRTMPNFSDFEQKKEFVISFLEELSSKDEFYQEEYIQKLSSQVNLSVSSLQKHLEKLHDQSKHAVSPNHKTHLNASNNIDTHSQASQKKALLKLNVKQRMEFKKEVIKNFDRPNESNAVTAFDQEKLLSRIEILEKYLYVRGPVLETQITFLDYDHIDQKVQAVCEDAVKTICEQNNIARANANYIAYLHKDTTYPHVHLQLWQKEPFLSAYNINNHFFQKLQDRIDALLKKPVDLSVNPFLNEEDINLMEQGATITIN